MEDDRQPQDDAVRPQRHGLTVAGDVHTQGDLVGRDKYVVIHAGGAAAPGMDEPFDRPAAEQEYRSRVVRHYNRIALTGLPERDPTLHEVRLEDIFVQLHVETTTQEPSLDETLEDQPFAHVNRRVFMGSGGAYSKLPEALDRQQRYLPQKSTLSVAEALDQHPHLVIIGGPGSGKTTLMRWLAVQFAADNQALEENLGGRFGAQRLPVMLELRRFARRLAALSEDPATPNLAKEIAAMISNDAAFGHPPVTFVLEMLAAGRCILLLDGLDEVPDLAARQLLVRAIETFVRQPTEGFGANLLVVTSRPHGYQDVSLGGGFQRCDVKPFEPEDTARFIRRWYDAAYGAEAQAEAEELNTQIEGNERVQSLARNPLLCTIIAIVYRNNRVLPNRRVELYRKCCEALLDTWERNKAFRESGLIGGYEWETKVELLAPIAYWLHSESERLAAPEDEIVAQLAGVLAAKGLVQAAVAQDEARRFVDLIRDRSGLLQGRGDGGRNHMIRNIY